VGKQTKNLGTLATRRGKVGFLDGD